MAPCLAGSRHRLCVSPATIPFCSSHQLTSLIQSCFRDDASELGSSCLEVRQQGRCDEIVNDLPLWRQCPESCGKCTQPKSKSAELACQGCRFSFIQICFKTEDGACMDVCAGDVPDQWLLSADEKAPQMTCAGELQAFFLQH